MGKDIAVFLSIPKACIHCILFIGFQRVHHDTVKRFHLTNPLPIDVRKPT